MSDASDSAERFEFAMGDFTAEFPTDRCYAKNHMWAMKVPSEPSQPDADRWRFGLTAYAVRLLQDVYFLDWIISPPTAIEARANIGSIESKKAESDLFAPVAGEFFAINDAAISDPSVINADCYAEGWLIEIVASRESAKVLLGPDAYAEHLAEAWVVAQRTIKGQANL